MIPYSNYTLLREKILRSKKISESILHAIGNTSENNEMIQMTETRLYVGLNDAETKKQIFETQK